MLNVHLIPAFGKRQLRELTREGHCGSENRTNPEYVREGRDAYFEGPEVLECLCLYFPYSVSVRDIVVPKSAFP